LQTSLAAFLWSPLRSSDSASRKHVQILWMGRREVHRTSTWLPRTEQSVNDTFVTEQRHIETDTRAHTSETLETTRKGAAADENNAVECVSVRVLRVLRVLRVCARKARVAGAASAVGPWKSTYRFEMQGRGSFKCVLPPKLLRVGCLGASIVRVSSWLCVIQFRHVKFSVLNDETLLEQRSCSATHHGSGSVHLATILNAGDSFGGSVSSFASRSSRSCVQPMASKVDGGRGEEGSEGGNWFYFLLLVVAFFFLPCVLFFSFFKRVWATTR